MIESCCGQPAVRSATATLALPFAPIASAVAAASISLLPYDKLMPRARVKHNAAVNVSHLASHLSVDEAAAAAAIWRHSGSFVSSR